MARSFNGSTDRIDFANPWNPKGSALSVSAWIYPITDGNDGYITNIGGASESGGCLFRTSSAGQFTLYRNGATGKYSTTTDECTDNAWQHLAATDTTVFTDYTDIHIYIDGTEAIGYVGVNGSSETEHSGLYSIGGRNADDLRNWNGYICEVAWWNRVLTASEIAILAAGYSPLFIMSGLQSYTSLVRDYLDRMTGATGTLDGTSVIEHPPRILYPAPPLFTVPAAVAADAMPMAMHYYRTMRA